MKMYLHSQDVKSSFWLPWYPKHTVVKSWLWKIFSRRFCFPICQILSTSTSI